MMFDEPVQTNVATIASPTWGFLGLNPLMKQGLFPSQVPGLIGYSFSVPFHWSSTRPFETGGATAANRGPNALPSELRSGGGPSGVLQLARISVAAISAAGATKGRLYITRLLG